MNVERLELAFGCCSVYVAMEEEKEENQKVEEVLIGSWRRNTRLVPRGGPRRLDSPDTYTRRRHSGVRVNVIRANYALFWS